MNAMDTLNPNPACLVAEAVVEVLRRPTYALRAAGIALVVLAAALWLPNYRLIGAVFATPGVAFGTRLQLLASLAGGLAASLGVAGAITTATIPVLFGVDMAMIAYFIRQRRAAHARAASSPQAPGRRRKRRDRGRRCGLRLVSAAAAALFPRRRRRTGTAAARWGRARFPRHRAVAGFDLPHRPQARHRYGLCAAGRTPRKPAAQGEHTMNHAHRPPSGFRWRARTGLTLLGFLVIVGFSCSASSARACAGRNAVRTGGVVSAAALVRPLASRKGGPAMSTSAPAYGLWSLAILNSLVFIIFLQFRHAAADQAQLALVRRAVGVPRGAVHGNARLSADDLSALGLAAKPLSRCKLVPRTTPATCSRCCYGENRTRISARFTCRASC